MPLLSIKEVHPNVLLGLWAMTEKPEEIADFATNLPICKYNSDSRRREYYCVRMLLREMTDDNCPDIIYDDNGKPSLSDGRKISISHTHGYCAVIISEKYNVAVDIETISNRVDRIAEKFIRKDEQADNTPTRLLHWCAKETMYKLFSEDKLAFEEMRVIPFLLSDKGSFNAYNIQKELTISMDYIIKQDYILVHTFLPATFASSVLSTPPSTSV